MLIEEMDIHHVSIPLLRPLTIALGTTTRADVAVVRLRVEGADGWGAASPAPLSLGLTLEDVIQRLREIRSSLPGTELADADELQDFLSGFGPSMPPAAAAVDISFHDAVARAMKRPLVEMLHRIRPRIITSMTIGIGGVQESVEQAGVFLAKGFRAIKMKIGLDLHADIERIKAVRKLVGDLAAIWVDGNQGYELEAALQCAEALAEQRVAFFEQPLPKNDLEGLRCLT
ncbi:hypothetical protein JW905_15270, partial [bacterium]|nr:hypothetical protein [candidate division CSSED10-310 bacterium]